LAIGVVSSSAWAGQADNEPSAAAMNSAADFIPRISHSSWIQVSGPWRRLPPRPSPAVDETVHRAGFACIASPPGWIALTRLSC